jgi:hypothetical protein
MEVSPTILNTFALQMKNALKLAGDNVPKYVLESAETFRQSILKWKTELESSQQKKVSNG